MTDPNLPTEPGYYIDKDNGLWVLSDSGHLYDPADTEEMNGDPAQYAPFTRLLPAAADPTAIKLEARHEADGNPRNPFTRRVRGFTSYGGHRLDYPFITPVAPNLYQGGVETGLLLPDIIEHVVSLYPWGRYTLKHELKSFIEVKMLDSLEQGFEQVELLAQWVNEARKTGPVLVHCQAGLNRSSLVVATAMWLNDDLAPSTTPRSIVDHMRATRSPAVLCNPAFEEWVLNMGQR